MATDVEVRLALNAIGFTQGANKAKASVKDLGGELTRFKSLATGALSFAGIGFGVSELVRAADQYGQMTARLQLATKATGDFQEVQAGLRQAAEDARAPLQATVNLYSQIAPSLQGILNSREIIGIITTVNQAIALSGSSAEASNAALVQFTQGLASGTLRGEELNSILEQTPALADAIAEGLGVARGQLRQLGSDGELTTERIVTALQKVSGRVAGDFASVPLTVGQALVQLQNSFIEVVGTVDQGTGATSAFSRAIVFVAKGIKDFGAASESLRPVVEFTINAVDGVARVFRIIGTGLAGYAVAIKQALSGDLQGALNTYRDIVSQVQAILEEPLAADKGRTGEAAKAADERLNIERKLADQLVKLESLRAVESGKASADILKSDKALAEERNKIAADSLKERLRGEEALADALRKASTESLKDAQKARDDATTRRTAGADAATSLRDRAADRRGRNLSERERSDLAERSASTLTATATLRAGEALAATRDGDLKRAARLAEEATKLAARAEKSADAIADDDTAARALEDLAKVQQRIAEAQAQAKEREAADLEAQAAAQNAQLAQAEERIAALKAEIAKPITLQADIAQAQAQIDTLRAQLDGLQDKTVTVTVNTVQQGVAGAVATPESAVGFSGGGYTGRGGKFQPAGIVHAGEFVLRQEVVRQAGMLGFLHRLNNEGVRALRGYSSGGMVSRITTPSVASAPASRALQPTILNIPGIGRVPVEMERATQQSLQKQLRREALKVGR
ncbi:MAG: tape measure protein [Lysobacteraceae bacterium]